MSPSTTVRSRGRSFRRSPLAGLGLAAAVVATVAGIGLATATGSNTANGKDFTPTECGTYSGKGCAPAGQRADLSRPAFSNPTKVTNPLFPISTLTSAVLLGRVDGEPFRAETTL